MERPAKKGNINHKTGCQSLSFMCADTEMTYCYVKVLCSSLKKLIRMYKIGQIIRTIIKIYQCKGFVCIPSSSTIFLDTSETILSWFVHT